jgi:maltose alpha-D-glucosyltransferase/alpha-amylase
MDAVPYLYEREGTNCENLPETYRFLRNLRSHVDRSFRNKILLAEANQWPEDAAAYFGAGDLCHMAFNFPVMPRMFMSLRMEDRYPLIDILEQTPVIPEACQWAMFLRNHDELTLEMVTDEERDYMYRVYAQDPRAKINLGIRRRLAPLLDNNRRNIELMNILLFSLPGTPVIYYGDEIGMGDNYYLGDRDGIRTPMQWSPDRNAGFSRANPHKLYLPLIIDPEYHHEAINVETQERNPSSLLWWMKRVIAMRKRFKAFGRGGIEFIPADNPKVLTFARSYQDETILVLVNLSRFSQVVELDLSKYAGLRPVEVFSQNRFPIIKRSPYVITLGPHGHFWLLLMRGTEEKVVSKERAALELKSAPSWDDLLRPPLRHRLEEHALPQFLRRSRWFGGKSRSVSSTKIVESIPVARNGASQLFLVEVAYTEGATDQYLIPLSLAPQERCALVLQDAPEAVVTRVISPDGEFVLFDALHDESFREMLLGIFSKKRKARLETTGIVLEPGRKLRAMLEDGTPAGESRVTRSDQSNTSIVYANKLFLKMYRRADPGANPEPESVRFITERTTFTGVPAFAGSLKLVRSAGEPIAVALLQSFVPNQGDAWSHTLDAIGRYLDRVIAGGRGLSDFPPATRSLLDPDFDNVPQVLEEMIAGFYLEMTRLLGKRTAELHLALASSADDEEFRPEPFSMLYQRSVYQSMRSQLKRVFRLLRSNLDDLGEEGRELGLPLLLEEDYLLRCFARIVKKKISATKIRIHGDYHLGQVVFTGKDFVVIDFEGEPGRPIGERRLKRSPFRDVAGMIRSFDYAAHTALIRQNSVRPGGVELLEPWVEQWVWYVSKVFLHSYLAAADGAAFVPAARDDLETLLQLFLLDKAVYELGYELNNRPDWMMIPMKGLWRLLRTVKERWPEGGPG